MSSQKIISLAEKFSIKIAQVLKDTDETPVLGLMPTLEDPTKRRFLDDPEEKYYKFGYKLNGILREIYSNNEGDYLLLKHNDFNRVIKTDPYYDAFKVLKQLGDVVRECMKMPRANPLKTAMKFLTYVSNNMDQLKIARRIIDSFLVEMSESSPSSSIKSALLAYSEIKRDLDRIILKS